MANRALRNAFLLALFYLLLIFILPIDKSNAEHYNLGSFQYRIVIALVSLPAILAWLAAFLGYAKLKEYALSIRDTSEGKFFDKLAAGYGWLAWSVPVPILASVILNGIANHWGGFHKPAIILVNYINLMLAVIAFSIIGVASRSLISKAQLKLNLAASRFFIIFFLVVGVLFCYLTFRNFDLSSFTSANNPYFLPVWLIVLTITIPYLYAWFAGLLAAYEIRLYSKDLKGVLYTRAMQMLIAGLIMVILSFIALQYINSVVPRTGHLDLSLRTLLVSLCRLIGAGGFVLVAYGAVKLKRIEEV
jgi:hypothetical protein